MPEANRSEKATPRRRQKARERGQVARSREIAASLGLLAALLILTWEVRGWDGGWRDLLGRLLATAARADLRFDTPILPAVAWTVLVWTAPFLVINWCTTVAASVAQGGFVFSTHPLTPQPARLNPTANVRRLVSLSGLANLLKSLLPLGAILYFSVAALVEGWPQLISASRLGPRSSLPFILGRIMEAAWKAGLILLVWSLVDYLLQHFNFERQLRMSRQEIREELKDTEGNPTVRGRIRRLQRQMRRRRMLKNVARAAVVVTNPHEYAVALEYRPEEMEAPVVLAKGRNLLAQIIKREARWHGIPLLENPPLAQALYRAVDVGQTIPVKLYAAVAEILAFVFRSQASWAAAEARLGETRQNIPGRA